MILTSSVVGRLGATPYQGGTSFLLWAPNARRCDLHLVDRGDRIVEMERVDDGYFSAVIDGCAPGCLYAYRLDGGPDRPDPASRSQSHGVHGPSAVVAPQPARTGARLPGLEEYVLYELHVGTFTPEGTFDAVIPHLQRLRDLGITAIELMPVAEFPGARNWGYDGVQPFAASSAYGGPAGLRRLVDACHDLGLAAVLDVVYNHLGPEGNYFREFGPYFHDTYKTAWGEAINFDGPGSDNVRRFFIENALYWICEIGFDALRLDAVHALYDHSAYPFLQELSERVHEQRPDALLIGESDLNDARLVKPPELGGIGLDALWADDLHHALHSVLTGEQAGYYRDFGGIDKIARALQEGWVYSGQYSKVRQRRFGNSASSLRPEQLVVCAQNHDQVGNRMKGERLHQLVGLDAVKLSAAAVLLSPYTPLLFMGEEYADPAPFLYFVSHGDKDLQEAVRRGRREEFAAFVAQGTPPDPQDENTFWASKLNQDLLSHGHHAEMYAWYRELLRLRREHRAFQSRNREDTQSGLDHGVLWMRRLNESAEAVALMNFSRTSQRNPMPHPWPCILDSHGTYRQDTRTLLPFQCVVLAIS